MIFNPTSRAKVAEAERLWLPKLILRLITIIVALIAIALVAWSIATTLSLLNAINTSDYYNGVEFDSIPWPLIPLVVSFFWNVANVIVRLCRPRPMHPGANVGMDLILWMALAISAIFLIAAATSNTGEFYDGDDYPEGYYTIAPNGTEVYVPAGPCQDFNGNCTLQGTYVTSVVNLGHVEYVALAFTAFATLLHFALFVWACRDTHTRNTATSNTQAAVIAERMIADMQERGLLVAAPRQGQEPQQAPLLATAGMMPMEDLSRAASQTGNSRGGSRGAEHASNSRAVSPVDQAQPTESNIVR